jgi:hypothetical protein
VTVFAAGPKVSFYHVQTADQGGGNRLTYKTPAALPVLPTGETESYYGIEVRVQST